MLAAVSLACGVVAMRTRRSVAVTAGAVGIAAFVVAVAVGVLTGFRIIPL